ncbi:MAG: VOC family protein [Cyclobacteriaceae bacterium]|nr:hypothetical protein [Cytophagales bacterium]HNP76879.1 VOC family protein [Cyclobacteriaceae bacterium]
MNNKIVPSIWFASPGGKLDVVVTYYQGVFGDQFQPGKVMAFGDTPSGHTEVCEVQLFGRKYAWMSTATEHQPLNDAISFVINCEDQAEIDRYWNYFTKEGMESQCGWCVDKFGLRWQVLPRNFGQLLGKPNGAAVMMKQRKIVISEYN